MRLIDADALAIDLHEWQMEAASRGLLNDYEVLDKVLSGLDDPRYTIEAEPVRHGKWYNPNPPGRSDGIMCSLCGYDSIGLYNYCPNCGALMRGGTEDVDR